MSPFEREGTRGSEMGGHSPKVTQLEGPEPEFVIGSA